MFIKQLYVPDVALSTSYVLFLWVFTATLWGSYYYYPHFTDEEAEGQGG